MRLDPVGRTPGAVWAMDDPELAELRETEGTKRTITEAALPELTGSASDVAAALEIRSRILMEGDDVLTRLRSDEIITEAQKDTAIVSPRQVTSEQVHAAQAALNRLRGNADAAWWMAQAERSAGEILGEMMS